MSVIKKWISAGLFFFFGLNSASSFACLPHKYLSFTQTKAPYHSLHLKADSFGAHVRYQASVHLKGQGIVTFYSCQNLSGPYSKDFLNLSCKRGQQTLEVYGDLNVMGSVSATWKRAEGDFLDFTLSL